MRVDRTDDDALYVDRWSFTSDRSLELTLNHLINSVPAGRPILIMDTNPNPKLWAEENIIPPSSDQRFPNRTYQTLTADERGELFAAYTARTFANLRVHARPILIVDHHFKSRLLKDASTTPLIVDYLTWLDQATPTDATRAVRAAIRTATLVRDHSDADIVLANFAARLNADDLADFGPLIRRIALFNDHGTLDPNLSPIERREVTLGYRVLLGLEQYIPAGASGAFARALVDLPDLLARVRREAKVDDGRDPEERLLENLSAAPEHTGLVARLRADLRAERDLDQMLHRMFVTGSGVRRVRNVLVLTFPALEDPPSGLLVMRLLRTQGHAAGVDTLVIIAPEGKLTHVKLRALGPNVCFDELLIKIRARDQGGGGRSGAAGLYASCGREVTVDELKRDLDWLIDQASGLAPAKP